MSTFVWYWVRRCSGAERTAGLEWWVFQTAFVLFAHPVRFGSCRLHILNNGSTPGILAYILVMWLGCRFLVTEVDGSSPGSISVLCVLDQDTLSALLQPTQLWNEYQVRITSCRVFSAICFSEEIVVKNHPFLETRFLQKFCLDTIICDFDLVPI